MLNEHIALPFFKTNVFGAMCRLNPKLIGHWLVLLLYQPTVFAVGVLIEEYEVSEKVLDEGRFDHLSTGFPLTGNHEFITCSSCHTNGFYEKLPRRCSACHDNKGAQGMSTEHSEIKQPCDVCHTTMGFVETIVMDHSIVNGNCISCHDGTAAIKGKTDSHVRSSDWCDACHGKQQWIPLLKLDHEQLQASCEVCHNGKNATGKPPGHVMSTENCPACHLSATSWEPPEQLDHAHLAGECSSCHKTRTRHPETSQDCRACHELDSWQPVTSINHDHVLGGCPACHTKPVQHPPTTVVCGSCHQVVSWNQASVDHGHVVGACIVCHKSDLPAKHIAVGRDCGACHAREQWGGDVKLDHNEVRGLCKSCHKTPSGHPHFPYDCAVCHATVNFDPAIIDHNDIAPNYCIVCHNSRIATGKPNKHCRTKRQCDKCHNKMDWGNARSCKSR